jgi:hypothetical protein
MVKRKPKAGKSSVAKSKAAGEAGRPPVLSVPKIRATVGEKIQAEDAFVRSGRSLSEIGAAHGRPYNTIKEWSREYGWEEKRKEFLLSDSGQADILGGSVRELLLKIQTGNQALTGPIANTILMAKRAEREIRGDKYNFTQLFVMTKAFIAHLRAADAGLLPLLEPHVEAFLQAQKEAMLPKGR